MSGAIIMAMGHNGRLRSCSIASKTTIDKGKTVILSSRQPIRSFIFMSSLETQKNHRHIPHVIQSDGRYEESNPSTQTSWWRDVWGKGISPTEQQIAACHHGHSRHHWVKIKSVSSLIESYMISWKLNKLRVVINVSKNVSPSALYEHGIVLWQR